MLFSDWYTDLMDIYRTEKVKVGNISREKRTQTGAAIPCRVYNTSLQGANVQTTANSDRHTDKLACGIDTDIKDGDELIIIRGGAVGGTTAERYIAGKPQYYHDPVGMSQTGIEHIEVGLLADNLSR